MSTKNAAHAAGGRVRAMRMPLERPETVVMGPDGTIAFSLPRARQSEMTVPAFQKYNPKKVDPKAAAAAGRRRSGPAGAAPHTAVRRAQAGMVPFGRMLFAAFVAQRVFQALRTRYFSPKRSEEDGSEDGEQEDRGAGNGQAAEPRMMPLLLRAIMPRPKHKNLAARTAEAHHARPSRSAQPTAWQRLHPANGPKKRTPGSLERWAKAVKAAEKAAAPPPPQPSVHMRLLGPGASGSALVIGPGPALPPAAAASSAAPAPAAPRAAAPAAVPLPVPSASAAPAATAASAAPAPVGARSLYSRSSAVPSAAAPSSGPGAPRRK